MFWGNLELEAQHGYPANLVPTMPAMNTRATAMESRLAAFESRLEVVEANLGGQSVHQRSPLIF